MNFARHRSIPWYYTSSKLLLVAGKTKVQNQGKCNDCTINIYNNTENIKRLDILHTQRLQSQSEKKLENLYARQIKRMECCMGPVDQGLNMLDLEPEGIPDVNEIFWLSLLAISLCCSSSNKCSTVNTMNIAATNLYSQPPIQWVPEVLPRV
jgi:hypothetical protein